MRNADRDAPRAFVGPRRGTSETRADRASPTRRSRPPRTGDGSAPERPRRPTLDGVDRAGDGPPVDDAFDLEDALRRVGENDPRRPAREATFGRYYALTAVLSLGAFALNAGGVAPFAAVSSLTTTAASVVAFTLVAVGDRLLAGSS